MPTVIWSTTDEVGSQTWLNSGVTVRKANNATRGRATIGFTSSTGGKRYWSAVANANWLASIGVGLVSSNYGVLSSGSFGIGAESFGTFSTTYGLLYNYPATSIPAVTFYATGDVIDNAVDFAAELAWWRRNGGYWNDDPLADPVTGVGGISFAASTNGGTWKPAFNMDISGTQAPAPEITANFGASAFTYPIPAGYTSWDDSQTGVSAGDTGQGNLFDDREEVSSSGSLLLSASGGSVDQFETSTSSGSLKLSASASITDNEETALSYGALIIKGTASLSDAGEVPETYGGFAVTGSASLVDGAELASGAGLLALRGAGAAQDSPEGVSGLGGLRIAGAAALVDPPEVSVGTSELVTAISGTAYLADAPEIAVSVGKLALKAQGIAVDSGETVQTFASLKITAFANLSELQEISFGYGVAAQILPPVTPSERTASVEPEVRVWSVVAEIRLAAIEAEDRTHIVEGR